MKTHFTQEEAEVLLKTTNIFLSVEIRSIFNPMRYIIGKIYYIKLK